jgi:hypothetical protein
VNDDEPAVSVSDVTLEERNALSRPFPFVVSLDRPSVEPVVVEFSFTDGTAADSQDYGGGPPGSVTFQPGETAHTVSPEVFGDQVPEADEDFFINITVVSGATLADGQGRGLILNDDGFYYTVTPCRVVDTREPGSGGPLLANTVREFATAGRCGIPADATAVAIVMTTVAQTESGNLRMYPAGLLTPPLASVVNFQAGRVRAGSAIIPLGTAGRIAVRCDMPPGSTGQTHFLYDVYGYFR